MLNLSISRFYFIISGFFIITLAAQNISIESFGILTLAVGLCYTFDFVFSGKFDLNILKSNSKNSFKINQVIKGASILLLFILLFFTSISLLSGLDYLIIFPLISYFSALQAVFQMEINRNYVLKYLAINSYIVGTFNFIFGALLILNFKELGYLICVLISIMLSVFYYYIILKLNFNFFRTSPFFCWNNSLNKIMTSFSITGLNEFIPVFIKVYYGDVLLGIYQLCSKYIKTPLFFISNILANYFISSDTKLKSFFKANVYLYTLIFLLSLFYSFLIRLDLFEPILTLILKGNKDFFIKNSIFLINIFMIDSLILSMSSIYIRKNEIKFLLFRASQFLPFILILIFSLVFEFNLDFKLLFICISFYFFIVNLIYAKLI